MSGEDYAEQMARRHFELKAAKPSQAVPQRAAPAIGRPAALADPQAAATVSEAELRMYCDMILALQRENEQLRGKHLGLDVRLRMLERRERERSSGKLASDDVA